MTFVYASSSGDAPVVKSEESLFTVITADRVYRIKAKSEAKIRSAFLGICPVLGVERDGDDESSGSGSEQ
jgi:hypothetical protein